MGRKEPQEVDWILHKVVDGKILKRKKGVVILQTRPLQPQWTKPSDGCAA